MSGTVEVRSLPFTFRPTAGPAEPTVWLDEHGAVVIFETAADIPEPRALLRFQGLLQSRFGYPNDEALGGHPLAPHGLKPYDIFEVINSPWIVELATINEVSFPGVTWPAKPFRHVGITMHDSMFEALCLNVGGRVTEDSVEDLVGRMARGERA